MESNKEGGVTGSVFENAPGDDVTQDNIPEDNVPEDNVPEDGVDEGTPDENMPEENTPEDLPSIDSIQLQSTEQPPQLSIGATVGIAIGVAALTAIATIFIQKLLHKNKKYQVEETNFTEKNENVREAAWLSQCEIKKTSIGKTHNIGRRNYQQDSFGITACKNGVLAVVADGMGGLADGDKVSQKIIMSMMQDAMKASVEPRQNNLYPLLSYANREVNHMLRNMSSARSGSTIVAVLADKQRFHWISVGDSRIYLFRNGKMIQINSEHVYEKELLIKAVNQKMSFAEALQDRQKNRVTSYIGMGELKYIEGSLNAIETCQGDRILIMSDGVFNTLSEREICEAIEATACAEETAQLIGQRVEEKQNPKQDNYTAIVLDF